MPLDKSMVSVGMRVQDSSGNVGTVAWVGRIEKKDKPPNNTPATYVAVEYDYPSKLDRCDGVLNKGGRRYCQSPPNTVAFLKPMLLDEERNNEAIDYLRSRFEEEALASITDAMLVKFCIARKFDMPAVVQMLEAHLAWVAEAAPSPVENFPDTQPDYWPFFICPGLALDGSVITVERPCNDGATSTGTLISKYGADKLVRMHITSLEMAKARIEEVNRMESTQLYRTRHSVRSQHIRSVTAIFDIGNLNITEKSAMLDFAKTVGRIGQDNFPEHLGQAFIINVPSLFHGIWRIVRFFLDDRTKRKIHVLRPGEHMAVLELYMDRSAIPSFLGGEDTEWNVRGGRIGGEDVVSRMRSETFSLEHVTEEELELAAIARTPPLDSLASEVSDGISPRELEGSRQDRRSVQYQMSSASPSRDVGPAPPLTRVVHPMYQSLELPKEPSLPGAYAGGGGPLITKELAELLVQALQSSSKIQGQESAKSLARSVESLARAHESGARAVASGLRAIALSIFTLALALSLLGFTGRLF